MPPTDRPASFADPPELPERYVYAPDPVLGEGGMGRVFRAHDQVLDAQVAIKVVRPELAQDPVFRRLFEQEVRVAARLAHPHIVPIHDTGELSNGSPFLALAYASGGSAASWVREPRPWPMLLRLALELLDALAFIHAAGALHRDVKPANILLAGTSGRVWLADLGLAGSAGELVRGEGRTEGTPGYMPPEQAMGRVRELCPASDLYAVGVVLWQLVTARRPFARSHSGLTGGALPPLVPQPGLVIPQGLDQVLANCLAPDPLARYDLAADVITELRSLPEPTVTFQATPSIPRRGVSLAVGAEASVSSLTASVVSAHDEPLLLDLPSWNRPLPAPMPVVVPPVRDPGEPGASVRLFTLRDPPLVGQNALRQQLWDAARAVADEGRSRVVVVRGPAGSGKTHLVRSITRSLATAGHAETLWLGYHATPDPSDGVVGAVTELVRPWGETYVALYARISRRMGRSRGRLDAATRMEAAELARWALPLAREPSAADAIALREVYRRMAEATWRGVSVVVLDGADQAQEQGDGLDIARAVLRSRAADAEDRTLVLVTVRPDADIDDVIALGATVIDIPALEPRAVRALIEAWLPLDPSIVRDVVDRCGGDPGLARDVIVAWAEADWLVRRGDWLVLAVGVDRSAALPASPDRVLDARIAALARQTAHPLAFIDRLHALSLAGRALDPSLFRRVAGDLSEPLIASGLLDDTADRVRFGASRLYEAVRTRALERSDVGALYALLHAVADETDDVFDRGRWALGAGARFEASECLLAAATRDLSAGRLARAERAAQWMLQATTGREPYLGARGQAWLMWGRAALARGENDAALERLHRAQRRLTAIHDELGLAQISTALGTLSTATGDLDAAHGHLERAEALCVSAGLSEQRVPVCIARGALEARRRNIDGAEVLFRRAEGLADERGDLRGVAAAVLAQAEISLSIGLLADADDGFEEARRTFERSREPVGALRAAVGRADVLRERQLYPAAERAYRRTIERADRLGASRLALRARAGQASVFDAEGKADDALSAWRQVVSWADSVGDFDTSVQAREALVWLAMDRGDLQRAYKRLGELGERLSTSVGHAGWSRYRFVGAVYLVAAGNLDGARGWLWDAVELGLGDRTDVQTARRLRALVKTCTDRAPQVATLAERALQRATALSELSHSRLL